MDSVLKGVANYLTSADTAKKFKLITYSEVFDEVIKKNLTPFIYIYGEEEKKIPRSDMLMKSAYERQFIITLYIIQDAKILKDVVQGSSTISSIWSLSEYVYDLISLDKTFNGTVNRLAEKEITSKIGEIRKDNTIKLILQTELTLIKNIFK